MAITTDLGPEGCSGAQDAGAFDERTPTVFLEERFRWASPAIWIGLEQIDRTFDPGLAIVRFLCTLGRGNHRYRGILVRLQRLRVDDRLSQIFQIGPDHLPTLSSPVIRCFNGTYVLPYPFFLLDALLLPQEKHNDAQVTGLETSEGRISMSSNAGTILDATSANASSQGAPCRYI